MFADSDDVINVLRRQAWERAKGELRAMLQGYIYENEIGDEAETAVENFIEIMEVRFFRRESNAQDTSSD